jgi:hypothetical protein
LPEVSGSAETKRACGFAADWRAWKTRNRSLENPQPVDRVADHFRRNRWPLYEIGLLTSVTADSAIRFIDPIFAQRSRTLNKLTVPLPQMVESGRDHATVAAKRPNRSDGHSTFANEQRRVTDPGSRIRMGSFGSR